MKETVLPALKHLEKAVTLLEKRLENHEKTLAATRTEPELFGFANENDRRFKKALASKLDNTIARIETLLSEE
ncbi:MAG: hypothetical protein EA357_01485 [Micavibrio sp.]|jgi:hypothetical protein|nr:MAG: hypothetical protein EA357_01485 [Micavibrio sp.]